MTEDLFAQFRTPDQGIYLFVLAEVGNDSGEILIIGRTPEEAMKIADKANESPVVWEIKHSRPIEELPFVVGVVVNHDMEQADDAAV